ncbi:hypothetical protein A1342_00735 [Methylomonas methanica]|uniref:Uncharacterized protein n=1 Tax=Methylomonas denitrificans TaxID=1538553 RepID=A0A126T9A5_9GAMM|nr:hypothetical protein JT25_019480 [Methylomonas denitrificans]OAI03641.1 hypothetical protein A1342_00735 [Methylomonas methanica]
MSEICQSQADEKADQPTVGWRVTKYAILGEENVVDVYSKVRLWFCLSDVGGSEQGVRPVSVFPLQRNNDNQ